MIISMIAAMAKHRVIGKENEMPWHLPADFSWFKQCTMGKPIVMGRKTFDSIGRPLPGRQNVVVSRNSELAIEGVTVVPSIEEALLLLENEPEVMIIGGGSIYAACLPIASKLYLTLIDADIAGDTLFPLWGNEWIERSRQHYAADEKNQYSMDFIVLEK
jgi:dihydrofolate reductase